MPLNLAHLTLERIFNVLGKSVDDLDPDLNTLFAQFKVLTNKFKKKKSIN